MTTANHVLAGVAIAVAVKQPALALPLALISHYVLDAIPHFGYYGAGYGEAFKHRLTYVVEVFGLLALATLLFTIRQQPRLVFLAGFIAVSPDLMWPYRYLFFERKNIIPRDGPLTQFHRMVQWSETPWGIFVEIPFFVAVFLILKTWIS